MSEHSLPTPEQALRLIRQRRAIFPGAYDGQPLDRELIEHILESARWAPTHRHTEPWRFRVIQGEALTRLGDFLAEHYKRNTSADKYSDFKYKKKKKNAARAGAVIAICMQRDPEERLPEWEEMAAVSCAVQNMWLMCAAHGLGAYWSSPGAIHEAGDLLQLTSEERCLGFFFMGHTENPWPEGKRESLDDKVMWMDS